MAFDSQTFLANLSQSAGIYQMFDNADHLLYVGKAKNLKKRVASYFSASGLSTKTVALVAKIARIEVTLTKTETEALLLEQNLIKQNMPPYNILLRDDKSYPSIFLSADTFPRIAYHRGVKKEKGSYFGPYPNASAVRETLSLLQRVIKVRQCEDSFYQNRTRPCLQYQIKRCTAPCVGLVSQQDYSEQVKETRMFLEGRSQDLVKELAGKMEQAAVHYEYETAAEYRDKIQYLQKVTEAQYVDAGSASMDVFGIAAQSGKSCVHVLYIRDGRIIGSNSFYVAVPLDEGENAVIEAFIMQFYLLSENDIPQAIVCNGDEASLLQIADLLQEAKLRSIKVAGARRGRESHLFEIAQKTAEENLKSYLKRSYNILIQFNKLAEVLALPELPERIECFDISHSSGESTVASCVVFNHSGSANKEYRQFNISGIAAGDDFAAMQQALERRFKRLVEGEGKSPDILLIDGGIGQVNQAVSVLAEFGLTGIFVLGIAKGTTRKAGFETLVFADSKQELVLPSDSPVLHLLQQVRDESHRFAVRGHTRSRDKKRQRSALEDVPGVGAKRRKELLHYFGSVKAVKEAPVRELLKVPTINQKIAEDIYAAFHQD